MGRKVELHDLLIVVCSPLASLFLSLVAQMADKGNYPIVLNLHLFLMEMFLVLVGGLMLFLTLVVVSVRTEKVWLAFLAFLFGFIPYLIELLGGGN